MTQPTRATKAWQKAVEAAKTAKNGRKAWTQHVAKVRATDALRAEIRAFKRGRG